MGQRSYVCTLAEKNAENDQLNDFDFYKCLTMHILTTSTRQTKTLFRSEWKTSSNVLDEVVSRMFRPRTHPAHST